MAFAMGARHFYVSQLLRDGENIAGLSYLFTLTSPYEDRNNPDCFGSRHSLTRLLLSLPREQLVIFKNDDLNRLKEVVIEEVDEFIFTQLTRFDRLSLVVPYYESRRLARIET